MSEQRGLLSEEAEGYSYPLHAPLYFRRMGQRASFHRNVMLSFRADPDVLKTFVPEPMELANDEVVVTVSEHNQPGHAVPVRGSSVSVAAKYNGVEGRFPIQNVSSSDEVLCANREELGTPSIFGTVRLWSEGNTWYGVGKRGSLELIRVSVFPVRVVEQNAPEMAGATGPLISSLSTGGGRPILHYKKIPSASADRKPWRQIMAVHAERTGPVLELAVGRAAVEFGVSHWGLHHIKPLEMLGGRYYEFNGLLLKKVECLWEDRPEPVG